MKRKMFVICTSIAALHLVIGGAVMLGGCTGVQEDEPMPSNAFLKQNQLNDQQEKPEAQETPAKEPETVEAPKVEDPVVIDEPAKEEPKKPEPVKKPAAKAPEKGDKAPAAAKPPVRANDIEYIVKKNDTYWGIAQQFGVSMKELETYNAIPAKKLRPGQKILIPATGKKITKPAVKKSSVKVQKSYEPIPANGIYVVKKNDSYSRIASRFGLRAADIAEYNNLSLSKPIFPNQKLKLPPRGKRIVKQVKKQEVQTTPVEQTETQQQPAEPTVDKTPAPPAVESDPKVPTPPEVSDIDAPAA